MSSHRNVGRAEAPYLRKPVPARHRLGVLHVPLVRVVVRRLVMAVPLLFIVSALTFVLMSLMPGDAARRVLGPQATPETVERLRQQLGLDLPIQEQYWQWLTKALKGDLGASTVTGQPVAQAIAERAPVSVSLIVGALLVSLLVGVGIGVFSAVRGGFAGRFVDGLALAGFALPSFWVGAILILVFAVALGWFPASGYVSWSDSPQLWLASLVLPVIALSLSVVAAIAKQTRDAMMDALGSEYVRMARANGVSRVSLVMRHTLKNAATRISTVVGLQAVALLGGTVLAESVFALPGLGGLVVSAAFQQDLPTVQGIVVLFTIIVVLINLVVDVTYAWLNPKVRVQ